MAQSRTLTIPNAGEHEDHQEPHSWQVRMQNGTSMLEDSLEVSYKTIHTLTIQSTAGLRFSFPQSDNMCGICLSAEILILFSLLCFCLFICLFC